MAKMVLCLHWPNRCGVIQVEVSLADGEEEARRRRRRRQREEKEEEDGARRRRRRRQREKEEKERTEKLSQRELNPVLRQEHIQKLAGGDKDLETYIKWGKY